jgi:putative SOS response-associated peptidase YedK
MCGRFTLTTPADEIALLLGISHSFSTTQRYNIAPTQNILIARHNEENHRELAMLRWGLIPAFVKDPKKVVNPINARSESVKEKPFFREAFRKRRCLIPVDGYYEWQALGKLKQPYLMRLENKALFFLAGIWEAWISSEGEVIETAAMLTTSANDIISKVHDRMPVILKPENFSAWLNDTQDIDSLLPLLAAYESADMEVYPVSTKVNSGRNENPECIEAVGERI